MTLRAILRAGNGLKCFLKRRVWDAWLTYCSLTPGDWVRLLLGALLCLTALIRSLLRSFITVITRSHWLEMLSEAKCLRRMHGLIIDLWPLLSEFDSTRLIFTLTQILSMISLIEGRMVLVKSLLWSLSIYYKRSIESWNTHGAICLCTVHHR